MYLSFESGFESGCKHGSDVRIKCTIFKFQSVNTRSVPKFLFAEMMMCTVAVKNLLPFPSTRWSNHTDISHALYQISWTEVHNTL